MWLTRLPVSLVVWSPHLSVESAAAWCYSSTVSAAEQDLKLVLRNCNTSSMCDVARVDRYVVTDGASRRRTG